MKISASVYSNKTKGLEALVKELDSFNVDLLHIDCNDNLNVFDDIAIIKTISKTPIDLHIISSTPEKYYEGLIKHEVDLVTFQYENLKTKLVLPKELKAKIGMAIVSETPISIFDEYKDILDFVLFMTTTPGQSGGTFNKENFKKIRDFKKIYPDKKIHVDGGVNDEVSFVLRSMGVFSVVSGSYLVNANAIGHALHNLRSDNISSHLSVKDFMMTKSECPVLSANTSKFIDVLKSIEDYSLGFTMLVDDAGILEGLISNADIRKGLIKKIDNLSDIKVTDVINHNPLKIKSSFTISEMLNYVKNLRIPILYLPVVDENNKLEGALAFNNLIKGE
jgi:pentose-5-phosphate-3-epimerase